MGVGFRVLKTEVTVGVMNIDENDVDRKYFPERRHLSIPAISTLVRHCAGCMENMLTIAADLGWRSFYVCVLCSLLGICSPFG